MRPAEEASAANCHMEQPPSSSSIGDPCGEVAVVGPAPNRQLEGTFLPVLPAPRVGRNEWGGAEARRRRRLGLESATQGLGSDCILQCPLGCQNRLVVRTIGPCAAVRLAGAERLSTELLNGSGRALEQGPLGLHPGLERLRLSLKLPQALFSPLHHALDAVLEALRRLLGRLGGVALRPGGAHRLFRRSGLGALAAEKPSGFAVKGDQFVDGRLGPSWFALRGSGRCVVARCLCGAGGAGRTELRKLGLQRP